MINPRKRKQREETPPSPTSSGNHDPTIDAYYNHSATPEEVATVASDGVAQKEDEIKTSVTPVLPDDPSDVESYNLNTQAGRDEQKNQSPPTLTRSHAYVFKPISSLTERPETPQPTQRRSLSFTNTDK